jgi:hypothetical protein
MRARLRLSSPIEALEIKVTDSSFRPVARGRGKVSRTVDPGIYELEYRAGPNVATEMVTLGPGQTLTRNVEVHFPSAAPVDWSTTSHEYHQDAARAASRSIVGPPDAAGLVVMVRNLGGHDHHRFDPRAIGSLSLLDKQLRPVARFPDRWRIEPESRFATWSGRLPPGGYALRRTRAARATSMPLWLSRGWQTLVFLPNSAEGPSLEWASIQTASIRAPWNPHDREMNAAVELGLWSLRDGTGGVADAVVNRLLYAKFQDPLLGIVGAHALLLEEDFDPRQFETILRNLNRIASDHPDVIALGHLVAERAGPELGRRFARRGKRVMWPPTVRRAYEGVIRADADLPGTIAPESPAEHAAACVAGLGVWTTWVGEIDRRTASDQAARRVKHYLDECVAVGTARSASEAVRKLGSEEVARAVGLPHALTKRTLMAVAGQRSTPGGRRRTP